MANAKTLFCRVLFLLALTSPAFAQEQSFPTSGPMFPANSQAQNIPLHAHAADVPSSSQQPVILPDSPAAAEAPTPTQPSPIDSGISPAPEAIFSNNPQAQGESKAPQLDPTLTTHIAAVQCAMAIIVEGAGQKHQHLNNPVDSAYQAGICVGKIQSYMLEMQAANPMCFPKIELEEGIRMFVKWVEAHPQEGATPYLEGFKKAFEDGVPCLRK